MGAARGASAWIDIVVAAAKMRSFGSKLALEVAKRLCEPTMDQRMHGPPLARAPAQAALYWVEVIEHCNFAALTVVCLVCQLPEGQALRHLLARAFLSQASEMKETYVMEETYVPLPLDLQVSE